MQIETLEDVESFKENFLDPLKEFYKNLEISSKKLTAFITFDSGRLGRSESGIFTGPDITCMEKRKEKLQKRGQWSYYLPAGWIIYPYPERMVTADIESSWVIAYHPIGGFEFDESINLNMCDDCGPNRDIRELINFPLDKGIFVTPRIKHILGFNSTRTNHLRPLSLKDKDGTDYYYLIVL